MTPPTSPEAADDPPMLLQPPDELDWPEDTEQAEEDGPGDEVAARPGEACSAPLDDAELQAWIAAIVDHDQQALMALYAATLTRVYGLALRVLRHAQLAEEVTEEVYFQVWRQAPRFDPARGRPLTWLLGMARSRAIDALRREARFRHEALPEDAGPSALAAPGDELLAVAQGHAELHRALLLLKPQPRQLVALAFFSGLSHEEIASQTCLPLGTVKSQIRRALLTLREVLADSAAQARPA